MSSVLLTGLDNAPLNEAMRTWAYGLRDFEPLLCKIPGERLRAAMQAALVAYELEVTEERRRTRAANKARVRDDD